MLFHSVFVALAAVLPAQACANHGIEASKVDLLLREKRSSPLSDLVKTAIDNVHVFDGYQMLPPSTVVIDGEQIGSDETGVQKRIDGCGGYLIPGLIDSHAHPISIQHLEDLSSWGVTTVINMACPNYTLCAYLREQKGLTSFMFAGQPSTAITDQHIQPFDAPPPLYIYNASQAPEMVQWTFGNNSDFYKVISSINGTTQAEQNALVIETHKRGKQAMTHAPTMYAFEMAVRSKTDGVQHTPGLSYISDSLLKLMKEQGQFHTPTLYVITEFASNPILLPVGGYNESSLPIAIKNVAAIKKAGIPQLIGTDAIGEPNNLNATSFFGESLHQELSWFVNNASFTPAEALRAATVVPAQLQQGMSGKGEIKPGKLADLVLLGSNPLDNISNTRDIKKVWNRGLEYMGSLNAM